MSGAIPVPVGRWAWLSLALVVAAGCNWVTGADDLYVGDGEAAEAAGGAADGTGLDGSGAGDSGAGDVGLSGAGGSGAGGSGAGGSGAGGSGAGGTGAGGTGGGGNGGGGGDPPPPPPPPVGDAADGVAITDIELYQGVRVPLMNASTDIPIVAGRDAMVRVFYQTDGGYDGGPVTARFSAGAYYAEASGALGASSSAGSLSSTLNIDVPGYMITVGGTYRVDLVQDGGSGTNSAAGHPQGSQQIALGAQDAGNRLEVVLVPVQNNGSLPDTSPAQVQKYADWLVWQYPIPEVQVTVRQQAHVFNGYLGSFGGWSQLLDQVTQLRDVDGAPDHVYYYGIHAADGNGLLGLGWVGGANDVWSRAAIGVGWTGDTAPETAVHEIGHNHGRDHAPCGVSGDPYFPHPGASIGVRGYHPAQGQLLSPNSYVDFMSYCSPTWVSDYTYKALFQRLKHVNGAMIQVPPELLDRTWERIRVLGTSAEWTTPVTMSRPPVGQQVAVEVTTPAGVVDRVGHYYGYDHLVGGLLYLLQPDPGSATEELQSVSFEVEGQTFVLPR